MAGGSLLIGETMLEQIDLDSWFIPSKVEESYRSHKESKTDRFRPERIRVPMGADGVPWQNFERNIVRNSKNISQRVLGGKYTFYPFREKDIPKDDNQVRTLSIASIRDVLVQTLLYGALYESLEKRFSAPNIDKVSFAYRRGKSAPAAARLIWKTIKEDRYTFILDADLSIFFDTLDHERLLQLIDKWVGKDSLAGKMLFRYIKTAKIPYDKELYEQPNRKKWKIYFQTNSPKSEKRTMGVPQGGILSGLLANLYLYEFDNWVVNDLGSRYDLRYFRYADDFVVLTKNRIDAVAIYHEIFAKIDQLKLKMHPLGSKKTKIIDISKENLMFLGFKFTHKYVAVRPKTVLRFKERFKESLLKERKFRRRYSSTKLERLKVAVDYCVNPKIVGFEAEVCDKCGGEKDRDHSWMSFFAGTITHLDQLKQLDRWMRKTVSKHFRDYYRIRLSRRDLRNAGMKSLVGEFYKSKEPPSICNCEEFAPFNEELESLAID